MPSDKPTIETQLALISQNVEHVDKKVMEVKHMLKGSYIRREEFDPIKKLVYGLVSIILTGVVGALLALIIQK